MNSKGIRRKKSSLSEVKVAVIGAPGVGKSGTLLSFVLGIISVVFLYVLSGTTFYNV